MSSAEMTVVNRDWINSLRDRAGRARIQAWVDRVVHGDLYVRPHKKGFAHADRFHSCEFSRAS